MLKQRIQGLPPKTIDYQASTADMDALKNLLAGEIEIYEEKASGGGTAMPQLPAKLNAKSFVVGARTPQGRISCLLSVPHMKETSDYNKVYALVVGKFTASYESSVKADYLKLKFDSKGA